MAKLQKPRRRSQEPSVKNVTTGSHSAAEIQRRGNWYFRRCTLYLQPTRS